MLQNEKNKLILYIIFLFFFIIITNNFYTFHQTLLINQYDGLSYMNIANSSYKFSNEIIPYHHAQRFYIPFLVGLIGNTLNIDNYLIFKVFVYFALIVILFIHVLLTFSSQCSFKTSIMISSIIFLNPYLIRYFISVPTMANDIFFLMGLYIFLYGLFKKKNLIFIGVLIAIISRQTGLFVFLACIFYCYENKMFKSSIYIFFAFIFIILLSNFYASNTSISGFNFDHLFGFFKLIFVKKELFEVLKWLMLPFYSFVPIILYIFTRKNFFFKNINYEKIILIFIILSSVGITILAGPELAGRNIIRQTTIVLPILAIYLMFFSKPKNYQEKFSFYEKLLILLFYISSLHPVYSKIKFLNLIKLI